MIVILALYLIVKQENEKLRKVIDTHLRLSHIKTYLTTFFNGFLITNMSSITNNDIKSMSLLCSLATHFLISLCLNCRNILFIKKEESLFVSFNYTRTQ